MRADSLPPTLSAAIVAGGGLVRLADCQAVGVSHDRITRLLRSRSLVAVARGVYADRRHFDELPPWRRFQLRSRAFVIASPPNAHASDWSAVALLELPTAPEPPPVPSVIRLGSRSSGSNRTINGRTRFAAVPDRWLTEVDGVATLRPAFVAVDLARSCDRRMSLMLADAAAVRDRSRDGLAQAMADLSEWPRVRHAAWAATNADPDAESPLETVGRLAFIDGGLPASLSNVWVGDGYPRWRLDHYWPEHRLAAEGDGLGKYGAIEPARVLREEKAREWQLQQWGIRVVRYGWGTAFNTPTALATQCALFLRSDPLPASRPVDIWPRLVGYQLRGLTPNVSKWSMPGDFR